MRKGASLPLDPNLSTLSFRSIQHCKGGRGGGRREVEEEEEEGRSKKKGRGGRRRKGGEGGGGRGKEGSVEGEGRRGKR